MGTGLLTDCTGLSLAVRVGFKGLYREGEGSARCCRATPACILSIMRVIKGFQAPSGLIWLLFSSCKGACVEELLSGEKNAV